MIEKLKSVVLGVLVLVSLLQTYLLVYSKPAPDSAQQAKYIKTEPMGTQADASDLIFPQDIVLHFGQGRHTVLPPNHHFYNIIFEKIRQRTFMGFEAMEPLVLEWQRIREEYVSLEIRFPDGIPLPVLANVMQIRGDVPENGERIARIWIMTTENSEEVRTFFFTDNDLAVYEVTGADLTAQDVEQWVELGTFLNETNNYTTADGELYVPEQPVKAIKYQVRYKLYTAQQLQNNLFVDPGISRNLYEHDGTEIFTDGKSGLQINHKQAWMTFSDPVAAAESGNDVGEDLYAAVQFINDHGGWNGTFMVSQLPADTPHTFIFSQYFQAGPNLPTYPILSSAEMPFGLIRVTLKNGTVSNYERSLINLDQEIVNMEEVELPGGKTLQKKIAQYNGKAEIVRLFPAYRPKKTDEYMELTPHWAVELSDGSVKFLP